MMARVKSKTQGLAPITPKTFSSRLLKWFDAHGRKHLPWQQQPNAYRVWVSEIMLQQTQVNSVIPYYERFLQRFPDVQALARAPLDEVLHLWTGLGYYARARNLHRAATIITQECHGQFPSNMEQMQKLPGIGRSTAAAILAFAAQQRHAILDGNVKRVLCRIHAIRGWPGAPAVEKHLWALAERYTPRVRVADYTQAIMDLGATLCTRRQPACMQCPFATKCMARQLGLEQALPSAKPRKSLPVRATTMLVLYNQHNEVLLIQRPPTGLWGGLWSLPECPPEANIRQWCRQQFHCAVDHIDQRPVFRHSFSHFHLDITPAYARAKPKGLGVMDVNRGVWYNPTTMTVGLAAPVQRLLAPLKVK